MATEHGEDRRRSIDPFFVGVSDGVAAGYQALERVVEGLQESLRLRAETSGRPVSVTPRGDRRRGARSAVGGARSAGARSERAGSGRRPEPLDLVDQLASMFAELLSRGGELAQDVAESIAEQASAGPSAGCVPELLLEAVPDQEKTVEFSVWNTGATLLREVTLSATELIGEGLRAPPDVISFAPPLIDHLSPGKSATVEVGVKVPADAPEGTYRALIHANPGNTCAVLVVTVTAAGESKSAEDARAGEATEAPAAASELA
jgi:hypothetical protein